MAHPREKQRPPELCTQIREEALLIFVTEWPKDCVHICLLPDEPRDPPQPTGAQFADEAGRLTKRNIRRFFFADFCLGCPGFIEPFANSTIKDRYGDGVEHTIRPCMVCALIFQYSTVVHCVVVQIGDEGRRNPDAFSYLNVLCSKSSLRVIRSLITTKCINFKTKQAQVSYFIIL